MRLECWALKTPNGLLKDHANPYTALKTRTFKTRKDAAAWAGTYPMYRAAPVKIVIKIEEKDF